MYKSKNAGRFSKCVPERTDSLQIDNNTFTINKHTSVHNILTFVLYAAEKMDFQTVNKSPINMPISDVNVIIVINDIVFDIFITS